MIFTVRKALVAPPKLRLEPCMNNTQKAKGKIGGAKSATLDI
ncbi:MAG: hypothetical protein UU23_C0001G0040 [Candidatus Curtissbacteria bacterium GW2011_GWA1_40_9]|uniref:Uncharacterized protein n=1 Tax=Candidatus Curtissbacteria bacterium GW2011_GWA1_40_9 TaxID=1618408 RepID=A0A0G0TTY2_9BACT|nr:MAG: hypothetical protein UU23_C0001G0040 [Candidatus Curtissbacteria bacterium GW2011_GWA1_40_9]